MLRKSFCKTLKKAIGKSLLLVAALEIAMLFGCGGGGDDSSPHETSSASPLTASDFDSFRKANGSYFADAGFADLIEKIILGISPSSDKKTYYIDDSGNDSNTGLSEGAALKTFEKALGKMYAGDTLIVLDGVYAYTDSIQVALTGSYSEFTTIKAKNKGKAVISGKNVASTKRDIPLMQISGSHIMVDGLEFSNLKIKNGGCGISLENGANHIVVSNCSFTNIKTSTLASKKNEYTANAIIGYGTDASKPISSILVYKNRCTDMETGWGECISFTENCTHISIIGNYLDDTGNIGIDVGGNYETSLAADKRFTRYAYIANNTVVNENTEDTYRDTCYGIYSDGGQHIQIIGNKVAFCMGGIEVGAEEVNEGYPTSDVTVKNNTILDCDEVYFACGGYEMGRGWVKNVVFSGNTCTANEKGECMVNLAKCDNVTITGNTFKETGSLGMEKIYKEFKGESGVLSTYTEEGNEWIGF